MITLIISGGELNSNFLKNFIKNNNINNVIAVDSGLELLDKNEKENITNNNIFCVFFTIVKH